LLGVYLVNKGYQLKKLWQGQLLKS